MEVEAAESKYKNIESLATVERLTASAPISLRVQQTNIAAERYPNHQYPTLELPTLTLISWEETQLVHNNIEQSPMFKLSLKCGKWRKVLGAVILTSTAIILMVWALSSIPTIFYVLPPKIIKVWRLPCILLVLIINISHSICSLALWTHVMIRR